MNRYIIVIKFLDLQTGRLQMAATSSVDMDKGHDLRRETVQTLRDQYGLVSGEDKPTSRESWHTVILRFPEDHPQRHHAQVMVELVPETIRVYPPTAEAIAARLVEMAPFTLTPV